jgi:Putative rRNA methylase
MVVRAFMPSAPAQIHNPTTMKRSIAHHSKNFWLSSKWRGVESYHTNMIDDNNSGDGRVLHRITTRPTVTVHSMSSSTDADTTPTTSSTNDNGEGPRSQPPPHYPFPMSTRYKFHPALSNVALAQSLWATVVRPGVDSAIDATCGNGHDSVAIAHLLFNHDDDDDNTNIESQLLCLDVQERAVSNTTKALADVLSPDLMEHNVQVLHASHEFLPRPRRRPSRRKQHNDDGDESSSLLPVGLVVYNLGWLPSNHIGGGNGGGTDVIVDKACVTQMDTTLLSLGDAVQLIRVGGMVSVVTYPKNESNRRSSRTIVHDMSCTVIK